MDRNEYWIKNTRERTTLSLARFFILQSDLYKAATFGTLKSGRLIEVGRLTEVQYKLNRKGSKHNFIASI